LTQKKDDTNHPGQHMWTLEDSIATLHRLGITTGWLVGGVVERGASENDVDIIIPDWTAGLHLPEGFHLITDSQTPRGPAVALDSPIHPYPSMKPLKTEKETNEYYNLDRLAGRLGSQATYYVEPKYDGVRVQLIKNHSRVWIYTDTGRDISDRLPNIKEELAETPVESLVLDAELVIYRGRGRLDHTAVTSYLHSKMPAEDYHLIAKPFDILYLKPGPGDMRDLTLKARKRYLSETVDRTAHIHPVPFISARGERQLINAIRKTATREGAMIKAVDSTYNHSGKGWYKWKRQYHIDVKVKEVHERGGGYTYTCVLRGGTVIGETYLTKIKANKGDIIEVSVDHVTKKKDGGWGWYAPKVVRVREDKTDADTIAVLGELSGERQHIGQVDTPAAQDTARDVVLEGRFVLQEHWWGRKHHFDLRFEKVNPSGEKTMFGWTLLVDSLDELESKIKSGEKILSKRKAYHDPRWLTFHGDIPPGEPGNPTVHLTAHMEIRDKGQFQFYRRSFDFVDMSLDGRILKGEFFLRRVQLKNKDSGGEGVEQEDWLFWKARLQDTARSGQAEVDGELEGEVEGVVPIRPPQGASMADRIHYIHHCRTLFKGVALEDSLTIDTARAVKTEGGVIFRDVIFAREMVQTYGWGPTLKPGSELEKSLVTAHRMVVTDGHPEGLRLQDIKGTLIPGSQRWDPWEKACKADIFISDTELLHKIKAGKRDLSIGFHADLVEEQGVHNGREYRFTQRNIVYDHLAVVDRGRCSHEDGCGIPQNIEVVEMDTQNPTTSKDEEVMETTTPTDQQMIEDLELERERLQDKLDKLERESRQEPTRVILDRWPLLRESDLDAWPTERLIEIADALKGEAAKLEVLGDTRTEVTEIDRAYRTV